MNTTTKPINQNKMKTTAVEWLYNNLKSHFEQDGDLLEIVQMSFEQAKAVEKEQMKYFIQVGYYAHSQKHKKDEELYNYWIDNFNK
jgi:hypothetical protein